MPVIVSVALRAALLIYCIVVPGWALLRLAGFSSASRLDRVLAGLAAGAAATSLSVTLLLLTGVYTRPLIAVLLLAPAVYLLSGRGDRETPFRPLSADVVIPPLDVIDRTVLTAAGAFLVVYLLDAWTSPIAWWDGLASWGKWAADWGSRSSSAHYVVGGYPQLVPRIASVMYKMTGASADVLPLDFFALHGFYVLFAAWFVVAVVRLAQLLDMPAWPVVLAGLGSMQFREHIGAGTVDVLLASSVVTLLALYVGLARGSWRTASAREYLILGAAAFVALYTKWTGGIGLLMLLSLHHVRGARLAAPERAAVLGRTVRRAVGLALLGVLPFVVEQGIAELRIHHWRPDPHEVNISVRQMPTLLSTDAEVVYRGGDARARWQLIQLRFWNSYDVPASLRVVYSVFLVSCLIAAAWSWFGRATLPILGTYAAIWLVWSSYDQRNLFGALPVLALCASFGAERLYRLRPRLVWQNGVALLAGLFLVLAGGGLLKDAQARLASVLTSERRLPARLAAMRSGPDAKVALFYPQSAPDYRFISALSARTGAAHVLATSPLFRFFPRGGHALSLWPYELVEPGDIFAGHEWHRPPDDPRWVLLAHTQAHRIWLRVADMPVAPVRPGAASRAGRSRILHDVDRPDLDDAGFVVWRAMLPPGASASEAVFETKSSGWLDPVLTSTVCETPKGGEGPRCSGIVALDPARLNGYQRGDLSVGAETDAAPSAVTIQIAGVRLAGRR